MGAMQAQDYNMAKWAIGIRTSCSSEQAVEEAFNKGEILRTHVMRPTWHFVAPENIRWMLPLTAQKVISSMKSRDKALGLTEEIYMKSYRIFEKVLKDKQHLTREELMAAFAAHQLPVNTSQLYHLLLGAESNGIICSGAIRQKQHTYALLEERVPKTKLLHKDEALAKLAKIYFTSHGPATLQDFVWWSGLSTTEAKHALEMVKSEFVSEKSETKVYWMNHISAADTMSEDLVHMLPAFDEYVISYKDRKVVLPAENHTKAISSNGIFRPVMVKNGQVIGIWKKASTKDKIILPEFFEQPDQQTQNLTEKAIGEFSRFITEKSRK